MKNVVSLSTLKKGQKAIINRYTKEDEFVTRLKDLGLVKGITVKIYTISPFGSPICIESPCGKLLLRKQTLKDIYVLVQE